MRALRRRSVLIICAAITALLVAFIALPAPHALLISAPVYQHHERTESPKLKDSTSHGAFTYHLQDDMSVTVQEIFEVKLSAEKPRHGIMRIVPRAIARESHEQKLNFEQLVATSEQPITPTKWSPPEILQASAQSESEYTVIKIGQDDAVIPPGRHRFTLSYKIPTLVSTVGSKHILSWNPIALWSTPIPVFSLSLVIPNSINLDESSFTLTSRAAQNPEQEISLTAPEHGMLTFKPGKTHTTIGVSLKEPLPANHIVTLNFQWPAEYAEHRGMLRSGKLM
jgi:hypothetical protein